MKLYYAKGACSLAVRITVYELNQPCEFEAVNLKTKQTEHNQDFLKINPKGAVPTLELDDGKILTENAVILQYLADTFKGTQLLPTIGNFKRYQVLEWVNFVTTELHKTFAWLFNPNLPQAIKDEYMIPLLKKKFDYVDQQLANKKYLSGDEFCLADGYFFVIYLWSLHFKIDTSKLTNLMRYINQLKTRPSIVKALQEEHLN